MTTMTETVLPGRCRLDPTATTVRFATRHLFGLAPVRGTMPVLSGAIHVGDPLESSMMQVELDADGFHTRSRRRDVVVCGRRYLDSQNHPTLTFVADGPVREGTGWRLDGRLTVRDVTQAVSLRITRVSPDGAAFVVDAETRIDRFAFGISASRGLAGRYLRVRVHARVVRD
ncbi:MAG TPA: YceI family protein [Jatrophihabitantaceae bacterium]